MAIDGCRLWVRGSRPTIESNLIVRAPPLSHGFFGLCRRDYSLDCLTTFYSGFYVPGFCQFFPLDIIQFTIWNDLKI